VASPNAGPNGADSLEGVSCLSPAHCVAVGNFTGLLHNDRTLVEVSNGVSWAVVPSPNAGDPLSYDDLQSVSCVGPMSCTAVGDSTATGVPGGALIESWNGRSWSIAPNPSPGPTVAGLYGVSCVTTGPCTAVGSGDIDGIRRPLIELSTGT
jgi:hypothetical protein